MVRSFFNRGREKITVRSGQDTKKDQENNFNLKVSKTLQTNIDNLENLLDKPEDLKLRKLDLGEGNITCAFAYLEGLVDKKTVQISILENLESRENLPTDAEDLLDFIYHKLISVN